MRHALILACALAACGGKAEPQFRASCGPDEAMQRLVCTVENRGDQRGRACLTARLQPATGALLHAPRACTGWIEAGKAGTIVPRFAGVDLAKQCAQIQPRAWTCKASMLETEQMLGENLPTLPE